MFIPQESHNWEHHTSDTCCCGPKRNRRRLIVVETEEHMGRVLSAYGTPLIVLPSFKYVGRILSSSDKYWPEVEHNLWGAWGRWGQMVNIWGIEREDKRTVGRFYVAVVQEVLLFGSEKWVVTPPLEKSLAGFHHQAVRRMEGTGPKRQWDGIWVYPHIGEALATVGLYYIGVYITRRQNTVTQ